MPSRITDSAVYASKVHVERLEQEIVNMRKALEANNELVAELRDQIAPVPVEAIQTERAFPTHSPILRQASAGFLLNAD